MENVSPVIMLLLNLALVGCFLAFLYIIGGIGDNVKKIRMLLEEKYKSQQIS